MDGMILSAKCSHPLDAQRGQQIGGWGVRQPGNRFVSCVRCEAVCARETMMFLSLGLATVNSAPRGSGSGRGRALCFGV